MGIHGLVTSRRESEETAESLIERVGPNPDHLLRFPHEFSGGQRQRIAVARALVTNPDLPSLTSRPLPRRLGPGPDPKPLEVVPERVRAHLPIHLAQPGRDKAGLALDRGDVLGKG